MKPIFRKYFQKIAPLFTVAIALFAVQTFSTPAYALSGELCIETPFSINGAPATEFDLATNSRFYSSGGACQKLKPVQTGLKVVSIGLAAGSIAAVCGVVSTPVGIGLGVGALVTQILEGTISLACDGDSVSREDVDQIICEKFQAAGIECNPRTVLHP